MTKKHFEAFAAALKRRMQEDGSMYSGKQRKINAIVQSSLVCEVGRQFNPNFDRERFVKACGLE